MRRKSKLPSTKYQFPKKKTIFLLVVLSLISYLLFSGLRSSAFFQKKDRINIVVEDTTAEFFSFGLDDGVDYYLPFFPDLQTIVPGGYGFYRLGALGKLASLEKDPSIYKRTYSYATASFIDYYFYPSESSGKMKIHFGGEKKQFSLPSFWLIFFEKSNAHLLDRLYIYLLLIGKTQGQFKSIPHIPVENKADGTTLLLQNFFPKIQGNFYKMTYRNEERSVQILYSISYSTAQAISQILEGEGIRVADLSKMGTVQDNCEIREESTPFSYTARNLSSFFNCTLVKEKTGAYDIIMKLGRGEKEWEVENQL